jgi:hypothetical protein
MAVRITPAAGARAASFELERFEWTAPDRLEIAGRWFGVRGLRFMRPTLDLDGDGDRRHLLALLEHKPWAAEDGEEWVAAFPWEGSRAGITGAELSVAPSVAVELALPRALKKPPARRSTGRSRKTATRAPAELPRSRALADAQQLREERDAAVAARDAALRERDAAVRERDAAVRERDAAVGERDASAPDRNAALRERDAAIRERDAAMRERAELARDRDSAAAACSAALSQLESVMAERDAAIAGHREALRAREIATGERNAAQAAMDAVVREQQSARAERDARTRQRDAAFRRRDEAERERVQLKARLDEALRSRSGAVPPPSIPAGAAPWRARALAFAALAVLVVAFVAAINGWI